MRNLLLLDMYREPSNPMEIGFASVTVNDDHSLDIGKVSTSRLFDKVKVVELIRDQTLIVKNTGTIYKHLRTFIPDISHESKPCKNIIGVTSVYTTDENRPADSKLISFATVRNMYKLTFSNLEEFKKKRNIITPNNGVADSVMFLAMLLDLDMIERLSLWQKRKGKK